MSDSALSLSENGYTSALLAYTTGELLLAAIRDSYCFRTVDRIVTVLHHHKTVSFAIVSYCIIKSF